MSLSFFRDVFGGGGSELRRDKIIGEHRDARAPKEALSSLGQFPGIEVIRFLDNNTVLDWRVLPKVVICQINPPGAQA